MILFARTVVAFVCFVMLALDAAAQSQRMAVPAGTIEVSGGGGTRIDAYCLDSHRAAPSGIMTSVLGPGASNATVTRLSDGTALPLDAAIESGWVAFGGLDSAEGLTVSSLDGQAYSIDIPRPIAMSEQKGELAADIAPTLEWMAGLDGSEPMSAGRLWDHRREAAANALGNDAPYAQAFGGLETLWEIRLKVDEAGGGAIAVAHSSTGADAFDRLVMAANQPIRTFSGPDADRRLLDAHRRDGAPLEIWLASLPRFEHLSPLYDHFAAEMDRQEALWWETPRDSDAEAQAEKKIEALERAAVGVGFTAAKAGLLWADADYLAGNDTLVVSEVPGPEASAAGGGGGKFTGNDGILLASGGGEPPLPGGLFGSLPERVSAITARDSETMRAGQVEQGSSVWTTFAVGPTRRVESLFASAFDALTRAVFRDEPPQAVIKEVSEAIEFNRAAYADLAPRGVVDLTLLLDADEVLQARVAILDTPGGARFAALTRRVERRP